MQNSNKKNIIVFIVAIAIPISVGLISALLTMSNMQLYQEINTPVLAPPSILFPIVWTILYVLMGVSSAIIYINRDESPDMADTGLAYYALSLAFNFVWSIIFFNFRQFLFAFIWLLALLFLIISTIVSYKKVSQISACLQIPYAVWVTFAGYLNFAIWILNR